MPDPIAFIHSPFKTKKDWEEYAALPSAQRVVHLAILSDQLGQPVVEASVRNQSKMGGMSGDITFMDVKLASGNTLALVLKSAKGSPLRAAMGNAREAFFYNAFAANLAVANVPKCHYAHGDMDSGEVMILMEALEDAVPSGTFFGGAQPNNWAVKDRLDELCAGNPLPHEITMDAFKLYAHMHAAYWADSTLLKTPWLRAAAWYTGGGEHAWLRGQAQAKDAWATIRQSIAAGDSPLVWDSHLVACLDASFAKVDWAAYQAGLLALPFTLVHGDAHAHNFMWVRQRTASAKQYLMDFEMVGVGSGAQELGQYTISHAAPAMRRVNEAEWVRTYHVQLCDDLRARGLTAAAEAYTYDVCFAEYVQGGAGRWAWFVPVLIAMGLPAPMNQFFHDQLAAFLHDHVPVPSASPMPRC